MSATKTERIDVRVNSQTKILLQEAAKAAHKNVSEFLLDAGVLAAEQTLAEQRTFFLDAEQWAAFHELLDRPVQDKAMARMLLREPGILD